MASLPSNRADRYSASGVLGEDHREVKGNSSSTGKGTAGDPAKMGGRNIG